VGLVFELLDAEGAEGGLALAAGQELAAVVHHRDLIRNEPRNAGGDQVHDALDLLLAELAAALELHRHRRAGRLLVADEEGLLGHDEVDPAAVDLCNAADGAGELALQGPLVVHVLGKFAQAELGVVEDLEADTAALRQPLGGELHADFVQRLGRDQDASSVRADPEGNLLLLELSHNGARILRIQVGVDGSQIDGTGPVRQQRKTGDGSRDQHHQRKALAGAKVAEQAGELLKKLRSIRHEGPPG